MDAIITDKKGSRSNKVAKRRHDSGSRQSCAGVTHRQPSLRAWTQSTPRPYAYCERAPTRRPTYTGDMR